MRADFGVIIISHGRPECSTFHELRGRKYTGKLFVLIDDEDSEKDAYLERYGASVRVFHKQVNFDIMDNFDGPNGVATFARNECWNVAEQEGLKYFLMMDDDLESMDYRYIKGKHLLTKRCDNFERLLEAYCTCMDETGIDCTGFGTPVDYIGGVTGFIARQFQRWTTSSYFFRTSSRFDFIGRYSEDGVTPILESMRGKVFLRPIDLRVKYDFYNPDKPQSNRKKKGGCQAAYGFDNGWVLRNYVLMGVPSCVKLRPKDNGWENSISSPCAYPKIISGRWKK